ncbi:substrate-binding domain-containing protein [Parasphingopyxis algicola]|uniref:substrate-binding domain-containing protein n=1 Tax=Parasphingopyxis algicola TaxID=2026624 RepID=UPI001FEA80B5|nr:substrate-binding domain-containing protein [Parasphingopyxis algicola]
MRKIARSMIDAAREGVGDARNVLIHPGQITIACGEGIGSVWLTPMMGTLQARVPDLITALHCDYDLASDHSERADLGITFFQPTDPDLIVARLGTLHFRCYGTERYFNAHGRPDRPEDMRHHKFIEQAAPGVNSQLREFFIGSAGGDDFIRFRTNSSLAVYYAVRTGSGLAFMPTYISHLTDKLQMVDIGVPLKFEMRYFYHREARESPAVRTAIEWLKAAFDPHIYPYFADEFIHPDDCRAVAADRKVFPLFPSLQE